MSLDIVFVFQSNVKAICTNRQSKCGRRPQELNPSPFAFEAKAVAVGELQVLWRGLIFLCLEKVSQKYDNDFAKYPIICLFTHT